MRRRGRQGTVPVMAPTRIPTAPDPPGLAILHVAVEVDSDPIRGTVTIAHGTAVAFTGWIELIQLLERAHKPDADQSCRRSDQSP